MDQETREKGQSSNEVLFARLQFLKNEGISLIERDCPWQAIGRWDEALTLKIKDQTPKDLQHDKILDMKSQALISLHEWEPAIEASQEAIKIDPLWYCSYQTLGRAYLGFGQLENSVKSFSKAIHLNPDVEELWTEDLRWASDLLKRQKSGNLTWKPIKTPDPTSSSDSEDSEI